MTRFAFEHLTQQVVPVNPEDRSLFQEKLSDPIAPSETLTYEEPVLLQHFNPHVIIWLRRLNKLLILQLVRNLF